MIVLSCNNLSKSYLVENILDNISFSIRKYEKVGLVGLNGCGKSTLFKILYGDMSSDSGDIYVPKDYKLGFLKQSLDYESDGTIYNEMLSVLKSITLMEHNLRQLEIDISNASQENISEADLDTMMRKYSNLLEKFEELNGYGIQSEVRGILIGLGFSEEDFDKNISTLSGGQKARISLGKVLLSKPKILLLDEPTNHLDIQSIEWLEKYIHDYDGTVLIISHDRFFLDNTVSRVFHLENSHLSAYNGNYTTFTKKKKIDLELIHKKYTLQQKEIDRQKKIIDKFIAFGGEKNVRNAQRRQKIIADMDLIEPVALDKKQSEIVFKPEVISGQDVLFVRDFSLSYGTKMILKDINFNIYRNEKIGLIGPNGIGKTSILNSIYKSYTEQNSSNGITVGHNVNIGYFYQEQANLDFNNIVIDEIWNEFPDLTHFEIRSYLAKFLFYGDDIFKEISLLSGGEKSRLSLLKLLLGKSNFLLMDEPTNHLDIDSKEMLEDSLINYTGTLLTVSHDRYFLNRVCDKILELTPNGIKEYLGGYNYYLEKKSNENVIVEAFSAVKESTNLKTQRKKEKDVQNLKRKQKRDIRNIEKEIDEIELDISNLESRLCEPDVYSDHILSSELSLSIDDKNKELKSLYDEWFSLENN